MTVMTSVNTRATLVIRDIAQAVKGQEKGINDRWPVSEAWHCQASWRLLMSMNHGTVVCHTLGPGEHDNKSVIWKHACKSQSMSHVRTITAAIMNCGEMRETRDLTLGSPPLFQCVYTVWESESGMDTEMLVSTNSNKLNHVLRP